MRNSLFRFMTKFHETTSLFRETRNLFRFVFREIRNLTNFAGNPTPPPPPTPTPALSPHLGTKFGSRFRSGLPQRWQLKTFRMPFQKGWGNGLTNQNRLGTLPIPSQTVSDTIDMAFWDWSCHLRTGVSCTSIVNSTIVPQEATFLTKF
jgi:hypothetical protein